VYGRASGFLLDPVCFSKLSAMENNNARNYEVPDGFHAGNSHALPVGGFADGSAQQPTGQAVRAGSTVTKTGATGKNTP